MGKRLAHLSSAALGVPLWSAVTVALGVWAGLIALKNLDAPEGMRSALRMLWLASIAAYFPVRIYRHYSGREIPMFNLLGTVGTLHLLGLAAFFLAPLGNQTMRSYTAEFMDFDFPVLIAIYLSIWAFACLLIALRYEKLGRFDATRIQYACAIGVFGVLLVCAIDAQSVVPQFRTIYASFGSDLPGPTSLLFAIYPYWYAFPLLGAVVAGGVLLGSGSAGGIRRGAFDGLIGLLVVTNLAIVAGLISLSLPTRMGCATESLWETAMPHRGGFTRLHAAARLGREESVLRLIARGQTVDPRDSGGTTPLMLALWGRHESTARALLAQGANVNAANQHGKTPLHAAITGQSESSPQLVGLLLQRGADVNAMDESGTPLDGAYALKRDRVAELLLQHGAVRSTKQQREAKSTSNQGSLQARANSFARGCG